jgi:hypothetical protein
MWHEDTYQTLFEGELCWDEPYVEAELGMAGLCRITRRSGGTRNPFSYTPDDVLRILARHEFDAYGGFEPPVLEGHTRAERHAIGETTGEIFRQWNITRERLGQQPLLTSVDSPNVPLVFEAAMAVSKVIRDNNFDIENHLVDRQLVTKLVSCWGPEFSRQWLNGSILEAWIQARNISEEEAHHVRHYLSRAALADTVRAYTSHPISALDLKRQKLELARSQAGQATTIAINGTPKQAPSTIINTAIYKPHQLHRLLKAQ